MTFQKIKVKASAKMCDYPLIFTVSRRSLLFTLKILLHEFDVLIGHICYGIGVGAVEVDEPLFCDDFGGLGLDGL